MALENLSVEHKNGKDHKQSDKPQSVFKKMSDSGGEGEANLASGDNLVIRSTSSYLPGVMAYQLFKANSLEANPPGAHQRKLPSDEKRTESFSEVLFYRPFLEGQDETDFYYMKECFGRRMCCRVLNKF